MSRLNWPALYSKVRKWTFWKLTNFPNFEDFWESSPFDSSDIKLFGSWWPKKMSRLLSYSTASWKMPLYYIQRLHTVCWEWFQPSRFLTQKKYSFSTAEFMQESFGLLAFLHCNHFYAWFSQKTYFTILK